MSHSNQSTQPRGAGGWVLLATILAASMAFIDGTALNAALSALQVDLHATGADLLWVVNGYALMLASGILVGGSLGDHYGRKRIYMTGIVVFAGASALCGLAPGTRLLIAARVVQGAGGALMVPGSLALLSANFETGERGRAIGLWSTFAALTTVVGPVLGGYLASRGLWRAVFFINLPLAVVALAALYWRVPESRDESLSGRIDFYGALLATLGLAGITYAFIDAPERGWGNPLIAAALIGGLSALAVFARVERRAREPLLPFRLFSSRTFSGTNLMTLFLYGALNVQLFFTPLYLIQIQGYDASFAGLSLLPFAASLILLSRWAGGLVDRYGPRLPLMIGALLTGAGFAMLAAPGVTNGPGDYWRSFLPGLIGLGLGMGLVVAPLTTAVMGSVSARHAGIASGMNNAVSRMAGVLALAVVGGLALALFGRFLSAHTAPLHLPAAAQAALQADSVKLGNTTPPAGLSAGVNEQVKAAIRLAFVDTYRIVAFISAGLAWLSALMTWLMVDRRLVTPED